MIPYHYSVVRCRDARVSGERRNVGVLVISPTQRKAWLRRGRLDVRAHLLGDDAAFVRALMDGMLDEAREVARSADAATVHEWLRSLSHPTEDFIALDKPAIGIAESPELEARRLGEMYLGAPGSVGRSAAETLRNSVLRTLGAAKSFAPKVFASGPANWRFPCVGERADGPLVLNALHFSQSTPVGVLDAAFRSAGRASELKNYNPEVELLTVATGPASGGAGKAFVRASELMDRAEMNLVKPTMDDLTAALRQLGFGDGAEQEHLFA